MYRVTVSQIPHGCLRHCEEKGGPDRDTPRCAYPEKVTQQPESEKSEKRTS
ncbi:hypothetical protein EDD90_4817 [Streptomyces sp. Ag109_O5-1]|nr:hypothetical protein EDD90_4817 [Streptomyces sp. Ag109_O5-1]